MQKFRVKSFSGGEDHIVIWNDYGEWECDCIASQMKPYKHCNHVLAAQGKSTKYDYDMKNKLDKLITKYKENFILAMGTNIGRIKAIKKLYERMDKLRDDIIDLKTDLQKDRVCKI